jgi:RNA polymerase sigma-70 factor (ECF subfamily)
MGISGQPYCGMSDQERQWLEEQALVLRAQLGDSAALGCLVARWQDRLWRTARRLTGDDAAAWDVVQESWTAVVRGIGRLDNPRAFAAWVYRILAASAAGWRRRQARDRRAQDRLSREPGRCDPGGVGAVDQADELAAALASLDAEHLAVVSLHYGEGLSVADVARILSVPSGTVKSRLFHARQHLRERLGGDEHE